MSIARVRMVDFVSEESSIAFEKEYIKKALELVPKALNLIMTRTGPESLLHIFVGVYTDFQILFQHYRLNFVKYF